MSETISSQSLSRKMDKSIDTLSSELNKIRTGRAHPSLLDQVTVEYYGSEVPINQVCSITVEEYRTLVLNVWEKNVVPEIEKSIVQSELGLNPVVKGTVIHIPMPKLTEERRHELIKITRHQGERAKVAVRNIRRDAIRHLKDAIKRSEISEDEEKSAEAQVEKMTSSKIKKIDEILAEKEKELTTI